HAPGQWKNSGSTHTTPGSVAGSRLLGHRTVWEHVLGLTAHCAGPCSADRQSSAERYRVARQLRWRIDMGFWTCQMVKNLFWRVSVIIRPLRARMNRVHERREGQ